MRTWEREGETWGLVRWGRVRGAGCGDGVCARGLEGSMGVGGNCRPNSQLWLNRWIHFAGVRGFLVSHVSFSPIRLSHLRNPSIDPPPTVRQA